jgi:K+-transporting ATPase ATPase C chain
MGVKHRGSNTSGSGTRTRRARMIRQARMVSYLLSSIHNGKNPMRLSGERLSGERPSGVTLGEHLRPAVGSVILLTLLTGCIFPLVLFALGRLFYPDQAAGSLVLRNGVVVGSRLIGQDFSRPEYFRARPSAAGTGYDGTSSGGTNFGPANRKLLEDVRQLADDYRRRNGLPPDAAVPMDAVTRSGSGLDPHISPLNAALQIRRVAAARGVREDVVRDLLAGHTQGPAIRVHGRPSRVGPRPESRSRPDRPAHSR